MPRRHSGTDVILARSRNPGYKIGAVGAIQGLEPATGSPAQMDLSYASNLEDYHLSQVFGDQAHGCYIDVGAGHPVAGNVSCWFYLRGWSGIVVEPQKALADLYEYVRPRDIVACCVLGRAIGAVEFHAVERLHGFSTIVSEFADKAAAFGVGYTTIATPMQTLASICARNNMTTIDFLKIDVEGAEGEVLAGNDWARYRPRVILCEAVAPGSMAENWQAWEPQLLAQGYEFVLFEGLNRFYVAKENSDILARFPREKAEWLVAPHLEHTNRAPFREDHPDHVFAKELTGALFAQLPMLDHQLILEILLRGEKGDLHAPPSHEDKARVIARLFPGGGAGDACGGAATLDAPTLKAYYQQIIASDPFRIMMGRLAMSWDGGQILD